jgi:hypothetical protein
LILTGHGSLLNATIHVSSDKQAYDNASHNN